MRVDPLIDHQILHSLDNDSKPELWELTHLTHGTLARCPPWFRSLPPALSALDSTLRPRNAENYRVMAPHLAAYGSRRPLGKHGLLGMHLRSGRYLAGLEVLP
jgi:hypothetical protein